MEPLNQIATAVDDFLWGVPMIIILLGTHIFMTVRTKFMQRKTLTAIKLSVTKDPETDGDISPFQALTTALASTIGTGNIIGVGTAIALGGAGADAVGLAVIRSHFGEKLAVADASRGGGEDDARCAGTAEGSRKDCHPGGECRKDGASRCRREDCGRDIFIGQVNFCHSNV